MQHAWDLYRTAKAAQVVGDFATVVASLRACAALPEAERRDSRLGNAFGWLIHHSAKYFLHLRPPNGPLVVELLILSQAFSYDWQQAINPYSQLLRIAIKVRKDFPGFLTFVQEWDLRRLQKADFEPFQLPEGEALPALAEQVWMGITKHLIAGYDLQGRGPHQGPDRAAVEAFLPQIGAVIQAHPGYEYLPYLRAQLYLALDQAEPALQDLLPFVRSHLHQYWAWDWLGRAYYRSGRREAALACFARALGERAPAVMTVLTRERYGRLCLETGLHAEARAVLGAVIRLRRETWGKLPARLARLEQEAWFLSAGTPAPNQRAQLAQAAPRYLYDDLPEELAVVTAVHTGKRLAWYRLDRERQGNLPLHEVAENLLPGDALRLRVQARSGTSGNWYQALTARRAEEKLPPDLARPFAGKLHRPAGRDFGFVNRTYFVPPALLQGEGWADGLPVQGLAVISYNDRRQEWGWLALRMQRAEA